MTTRRTMLLASASLAGNFGLLACTRNEGQARLFVAKSLEHAVTEMTAESGPLQGAQVVAAGSQSIARQIEATRRGEVIISADLAWIEWLKERGLAPNEPPLIFAQNQLVLVGHRATRHRIETARDLTALRFSHLSIGDPLAVPVGRYAKETLVRHGLWEALLPRIETAVNVRAALGRAIAHRDELALVYATDAAHEQGVRVLHRFDVAQTKIKYFAARLTCAHSEQLATGLLAGLTSSRAAETLQRHGFLLASEQGEGAS